MEKERYLLPARAESSVFRSLLFRFLQSRLLCSLDSRKAFCLWKCRTLMAEVDEFIRSEYYLQYQQLMRAVNTPPSKRTSLEKQVIWDFTVSKLSSTIPVHDMKESEKDRFCQDVQVMPPIDDFSILFLQGDTGNCYYIIAYGQIGLYLERDQDKENEIGRRYGTYRHRAFPGTEVELRQVGEKIVTLSPGAGFGEGALLSRTKKTRMCAAVTTRKMTIVLVLQESTYNAVLRRHHFNQFQFSLATSLLRSMPHFEKYAYSQIAGIARSMHLHSFRLWAPIVKAGEKLKCVYVVSNGRVKMYHAADGSDTAKALPELQKRIPRLALVELGFGKVIGEREMQLEMKQFQHTYVADAHNTELFEIPINTFEAFVTGRSLRKDRVYLSMEQMHIRREQQRKAVINSWQVIMDKVMLKKAADAVLVDNLMAALPLIALDNVVETDENESRENESRDSINLIATSDKVNKNMNVSGSIAQKSSSMKVKPSPPLGPYKHVIYESPKQKAIRLYKQMLKTT